MNLIRIFLVAWMFEHPRMPSRMVEGDSGIRDSISPRMPSRMVEGDSGTRDSISPRMPSRMVEGDSGTRDSIFPSPEVQDIHQVEVMDNSDAYQNIDDCSIFCNYNTIIKQELNENYNENDVYSEKLLVFSNRTNKEDLKKTRNNFPNGNVYCNCDLEVRISRSIDPLKHLPSFAQSEAFSDLELKNRVEKDLKMLLNDAVHGNERLFSSDRFADVLLSIPSPLRYNDELLPEQFEQEIVETENASIRNEDLTLTEDFTNIEKTLEKNLSLIGVIMEGELLKVPPTLIPGLDVLPDSTTDSSDSLIFNPTQKVETADESRQLNNSRFPEGRAEVNLNVSDVYAVFRSRYPVGQWKTVGYFTEDYLEVINRHWLQFPPPYHSSHYILAALYAIIMTVGVTGNCLVIFMFIRCRSLRTPANVLVMNLAVSDFFLLAKMPVFIFNCFYFGPALGAIGCEIYGFLGGLTGTVSIMTLAAIALDRYYVIVYPLDPLRRTTRQRARLCVAFVWCYGCTFASLPLTGYGFSRYVPEGYLTSCSFDYLDQSVSNRVFILVFFFAAWVVPFSVITFCYSKIYRVVISGSSGASSRRGQEEEKRKTEIRLAGVIVGVIGLWFLSWTPYAVVALLGISGNAHLISPLSSMIPALFCKTASCVDPYVYAVTHPRFRREFQRFFCKKQARRRLDTGKTQCWKTETSQIPGMMIGIRPQRVDYSLSEEDIEEMVVMVDNSRAQKTYFTASTIAPEEHSLCEITFPPDSRTNEMLQHPSWFMPPQPRRDRSTSLKLTGRRNSRNTNSDPTSV